MSEEVVTITINGQEIKVPQSTNLIKAAETAGIEIPHYCYHSQLSSPAVCRMCLVEVEGARKLSPACNMPLQNGMVVRTDSPKVKEAVKEVLEFTLINHPLDCPVCDQAGECGLQNYYQEYGLYNSRFTLPKVHKPKVVEIGPTLMLDAERCILCTRCVRFTEEVTHTHDMAIVQRGDHSEIKAVKTVDNPYSTNLADICPVGALTERDFRFRIRVWYLKEADSICTGCARGCNVTLDHHRGEVHRIRPRENLDVNKTWMCDEGRLLYKRFTAANRIQQPQLRKDDELVDVTWEEALEAVTALLQSAKGKVATQASAQLSNEDNFALANLCKALGAPAPAIAPPSPEGWQDDDMLIRADRTPNRKGADALSSQESFQALLKAAQVALVIQEQNLGNPEAYGQLEGIIFAGTHHNAASQVADIVLPLAEWVEYTGSMTNFEGRVQRFNRTVPPIGQAKAPWQLFELIGSAFAGTSHESVSACFNALASSHELFRGIQFTDLGRLGAASGSSQAASGKGETPAPTTEATA